MSSNGWRRWDLKGWVIKKGSQIPTSSNDLFSLRPSACPDVHSACECVWVCVWVCSERTYSDGLESLLLWHLSHPEEKERDRQKDGVRTTQDHQPERSPAVTNSSPQLLHSLPSHLPSNGFPETEVNRLSVCTKSVSLSCQGESASRALQEIPALMGSRSELQDGRRESWGRSGRAATVAPLRSCHSNVLPQKSHISHRIISFTTCS